MGRTFGSKNKKPPLRNPKRGKMAMEADRLLAGKLEPLAIQEAVVRLLRFLAAAMDSHAAQTKRHTDSLTKHRELIDKLEERLVKLNLKRIETDIDRMRAQLDSHWWMLLQGELFCLMDKDARNQPEFQEWSPTERWDMMRTVHWLADNKPAEYWLKREHYRLKYDWIPHLQTQTAVRKRVEATRLRMAGDWQLPDRKSTEAQDGAPLFPGHVHISEYQSNHPKLLPEDRKT